MATEKEKKQVMDIAKPGTTSASPTARPIIVNHGGMMKDPMVTDQTDAEPKAETKAATDTPTEPTSEQKTAPSSHKVIQPLSSDKADAKPKKDETSDSKETEDEQSEDVVADEAVSSEEAEVDAVIDQVGNKKKQNELSEEEKKQQETINKLIEDKTYFVPIGQVARRHRQYALIVFLVVLLLIVGAAAYVYMTGIVTLKDITSLLP